MCAEDPFSQIWSHINITDKVHKNPYIACYTAALNTVTALLEYLDLNVTGFRKPQKSPWYRPCNSFILGIMIDASVHLLCSKLCKHSRLVCSP